MTNRFSLIGTFIYKELESLSKHHRSSTRLLGDSKRDIDLQPLGAAVVVSAGLGGRVFDQREEGGDHFIRGISFRDHGIVELHSVRGGIVRYLIFS